MSLGDDALVGGHRLSEWCGHAHELEEDIALANIALDEIGRANVFLMYAGELEGMDRDEDQLAYFRSAVEFRNLQLLEQPNTDFAYTIVRQFLYDAYAMPLFESVARSPNEIVSGLARKARREITYHLRHTRSWVVRLGDGTSESHDRVQSAVDDLWMYTSELFEMPPGFDALESSGLIPDAAGKLREQWEETVSSTLKEATLSIPDNDQYMATGGRMGRHTEHLGYILAEMQILARSHPGATW